MSAVTNYLDLDLLIEKDDDGYRARDRFPRWTGFVRVPASVLTTRVGELPAESGNVADRHST